MLNPPRIQTEGPQGPEWATHKGVWQAGSYPARSIVYHEASFSLYRTPAATSSPPAIIADGVRTIAPPWQLVMDGWSTVTAVVGLTDDASESAQAASNAATSAAAAAGTAATAATAATTAAGTATTAATTATTAAAAVASASDTVSTTLAVADIPRAGAVVVLGRDPSGAVAAYIDRWGALRVGPRRRDVGAALDSLLGSTTGSATVAPAALEDTSDRARIVAVLGRDPSGAVAAYIDERGRVRVRGRDIGGAIDDIIAGTGAFADRMAEIRALAVPGDDFLVFGDSLSQFQDPPASWGQVVASTLGRPATTRASPGFSSSQIVGCAGAAPFFVTLENNVMLASGASLVTRCVMYDPDGGEYTVRPVGASGSALTMRVRLDGIYGAFSAASSADPIYFTPDAGQISADRIVPAEAMTGLGLSPNLQRASFLACMGRNAEFSTDLPRTIKIVRRNIDALARFQHGARRRVVFVCPSAIYGEAYGSDRWAYYREIELYARSVFGDQCISSRQLSYRYATSSTEDQEALVGQYMPPSCTVNTGGDKLHWSVEFAAHVAETAVDIIQRTWK